MSAHIIENALEGDLYKSTYIGHTLSQVLEMALMGRWWRRCCFPSRIRRDDLLHGEAVALDILVTACIAHRRGVLPSSDLDRLADLFHAIGVPLWNPLLAKRRLIASGMAESTKHRNGQLRLPLPDGIGKCAFADDITFPTSSRPSMMSTALRVAVTAYARRISGVIGLTALD